MDLPWIQLGRNNKFCAECVHVLINDLTQFPQINFGKTDLRYGTHGMPYKHMGRVGTVFYTLHEINCVPERLVINLFAKSKLNLTRHNQIDL